MITIKSGDQPAYTVFSFDEVAVECDCAPGDLQREMEKVRQRLSASGKPAHSGLRAMALADVERVASERGKPVTLPAALDGFGPLCRYDDAVRALGIPGADFEEAMRKAKAPITTVEALTAAGRDYALANCKHLAADKPPPGITGSKVLDWRASQRRKKEQAAEIAGAVAARNPAANRRQLAKLVADEETAARRQPRPARGNQDPLAALAALPNPLAGF